MLRIILSGNCITLPTRWSSDLTDFIMQLLKVDPIKRMNTLEHFQSHRYMARININDVLNKLVLIFIPKKKLSIKFNKFRTFIKIIVTKNILFRKTSPEFLPNSKKSNFNSAYDNIFDERMTSSSPLYHLKLCEHHVSTGQSSKASTDAVDSPLIRSCHASTPCNKEAMQKISNAFKPFNRFKSLILKDDVKSIKYTYYYNKNLDGTPNSILL